MCANFEPITKAQASLFTNQQLSFDFKTDISPGYDCPLLFAKRQLADGLWWWLDLKFVQSLLEVSYPYDVYLLQTQLLYT